MANPRPPQRPVKRDLIDFDVFSPLTVGRMLRGTDMLRELMRDHRSREKNGHDPRCRGPTRAAPHRHQVLPRRDRDVSAGTARLAGGRGPARERDRSVRRHSPSRPNAVFSEEWIDLAGQMMPQARFEQLCDADRVGADRFGRQVASRHSSRFMTSMPKTNGRGLSGLIKSTLTRM